MINLLTFLWEGFEFGILFFLLLSLTEVNFINSIVCNWSENLILNEK